MKKMPTPSEAEEQITVIEYCDLKGIPIYHIANEGKRTKYTGDLLKRMGMRTGFPDLCVPVAKGKFRGLNALKHKAMQPLYAMEQARQ